MTFVESFYSFNVDLNQVDRKIYLKTRVKIPKHPSETQEHLLARVLAFTHAYQDGLTFSRGLFAPEEPTLWKKAVTGQVETWIDVGRIDLKKLRHSLRRHPLAPHILYIYEKDSLVTLGQGWHRFRPEDFMNVTCHYIPMDFLKDLTGTLKSCSDWQLTIIDHGIYLTSDGKEFQTKIETVDLRRLPSLTTSHDGN